MVASLTWGWMEEGLAEFLQAGPNKALAVAPNGAYGYATGRASLALARSQALDGCRALECKVVITVGGEGAGAGDGRQFGRCGCAFVPASTPPDKERLSGPRPAAAWKGWWPSFWNRCRP